MSSTLELQHPIYAPLEAVTDQSPLKVKLFTGLLIVGHPLYHLAWTRLYRLPYDSVGWRATASVLAVLAALAIYRLGLTDRRTAFIWGVASAFGTVGLSSWFYAANGGHPAWLASMGVMTVLYFTLSDWRIALPVTLLAYLSAYFLVPALEVGVYAAGAESPLFTMQAWLVLSFALVMAVLTRYTDMSMAAVRLRSQTRAMGITAHEIRTPLAGLQLLSGALQQRVEALAHGRALEGDELADIRELAGDLVRSCEDAQNVLATHLANSNPFKPFARREAVSLADVASEAVGTFERGSGSGARLVRMQIEGDFAVLGDAGALKQSIVNLLNNSLRAVVRAHHCAAPGQIEIIVRYVPSRGIGQVVVRDTGCGIAPEKLSRIFEPFVSGDVDQGHGLGLTFVRSVVSAYGGDIQVDSSLGQGTNFTLQFDKATPR